MNSHKKAPEKSGAFTFVKILGSIRFLRERKAPFQRKAAILRSDGW